MNARNRQAAIITGFVLLGVIGGVTRLECQSSTAAATGGMTPNDRVAPRAAQPPEERAQAQACAAAGYRQLDAWIGHWYIATDEGRLQGESEVSRAVGRCGLVERWHGASGGHGRSLSVYDPGVARWRYLFVNDTGLVLVAEGEAAGRGLTWTVTHLSESVPGQLEQWDWSTVGGIRHIGRTSEDSGKTWNVRFDVWYRHWAGGLPPNSRHNGPCHATVGYRSLDFMVGDWDVMSGGARVAESRVDTVLQGCAVLEREQPNAGVSVLRLAGYDVSVGAWRAIEETSAGGGTRLDGAIDSAGVSWTPVDGSAGAASGVLTRRLLTRRADGTLRSRIDASRDSGQTWHTTSEATYRRRARGAG